jgi:hypothetical protein
VARAPLSCSATIVPSPAFTDEIQHSIERRLSWMATAADGGSPKKNVRG